MLLRCLFEHSVHVLMTSCLSVYARACVCRHFVSNPPYIAYLFRRDGEDLEIVFTLANEMEK